MSWICPKCERELKHVNATHYCIKVSVDSLFEGRPAELVLVFDKILAEVADWDDVLISTSKNCIVFVHKRTFFVIRPMKKQLELRFYSKAKPESPIITKSIFRAGKYDNSTHVSQLTDLTMELFGMIKTSYILL